MNSMSKLLHPASIAVVGASQKGGRGARVLINLRELWIFTGDVFPVHPRYDEVQGYYCVPTVAALPPNVDCVVVAVSADSVCDVLENLMPKASALRSSWLRDLAKVVTAPIALPDCMHSPMPG